MANTLQNKSFGRIMSFCGGLIPCVAVFLLSSSCGPKGEQSSKRHTIVNSISAPSVSDLQKNSESLGDGDSEQLSIALTDGQAEAFFNDKCTSCHGKGGAYASFWPQPEKFSIQLMEADPFRENVYQSIYNSSRGKRGNGQPAMMPPGETTDDLRKTAKSMIAWYRSKLPGLAAGADKTFSNSDESVVAGVNYIFTCTAPLSIREFLFRFYQDVYSRNPDFSELKEFGDAGKPVTLAIRTTLAERIAAPSSKYRQEFIETGLLKFAQKFSGVNELALQPSEGITKEVVDSLKMEFYQKLKNDFSKTKFRDILLSNTVMVNSVTAPLYGAPRKDCAVPKVGEWGKCEMDGRRETFWGSFGFLASKPTTFLTPSNNFGRAALMHFSIAGDVLLAATNGPKGEEVADMPACLKSKDLRGEKQTDGSIAPYGSSKIPQSGNICQSCHIARNLSVGSMMFRPFSRGGKVLTANNISADDPIYGDLVKANIQENKIWQNGSDGPLVPVTADFLKTLLDYGPEKEAGCIPGGRKDGTDIPIGGLTDLAQYMMGEGGVALANGLGRHLPRSMSNLALTTNEILVRVTNNMKLSGGTLSSAFEAYFTSETFACKTKASDN